VTVSAAGKRRNPNTLPRSLEEAREVSHRGILCVLIAVSAFMLMACGGGGAPVGGDGGIEPKPVQPEQPDPDAPPAVRLQEFFAKNKNHLPAFKVELMNGGLIEAQWSMNEGLTDSLTRGTAKYNTTSMLRTVSESNVDYDHVVIRGGYPLVDKFGNSEYSEVVRATYKRSTVDRINWENSQFVDVYFIADGFFLHPAFREAGDPIDRQYEAAGPLQAEEKPAPVINANKPPVVKKKRPAAKPPWTPTRK